jgi:hypothetical protein
MNNDFERLSLRKFKIKGMVPNATVLLLGRRRSGKCLEKGTEIIMYDGHIKKIEDITVGDLVMGDDSTPRMVLGTNNGIDTMYKITNQKGESYTVNSEHILSLKYTAKKNIRDRVDRDSYQVYWFDKVNIKLAYKTFSYKNKNKDDVYKDASIYLDSLIDDRYIDIPIKKYMSLSKKYTVNLHGYQVPIEFQHKKLEIDPYMLGIWLGDGNSNTSIITNQDSSVIKFFKENLGQYKCYLNFEENSGHYKYRINGDGSGKQNSNYFLNVLCNYNLLHNKHIPHNYKCNSRENRLKLLAGILDADGSYKDGCFEITQSLDHETLLDDIIYLSRSLGFSCYKNKKTTTWTYKGEKKNGLAWRIIISGNGIDKIPTLISRKKANKRIRLTDVLVSSIKIEKLPENEYYGFELDGNHRFVLSNFIVTHNSYLVRDIFYHHKEIPIGLIFSGTEEANPFFGDFIPDSFIHSEYDPALIETMLIKQSQKVKKARQNGHAETDGLTPSNRAFIVLDDMLHDAAAWKKEKTIQSIFFNGRHYNLFFILTMQYPLGIPPALRSNIDYVFVFNEPSIKNRKKIYDDYAGMCPSFDHFCNILDSCTQNHECLVIKTSGNSSDLRDQIFWYKASKHDNFRVGHPKIWKYHDLHYNDKYDTQRDVEQEAVDKLKKKFAKTKKLKIIVNRQGEALEAIEESE